MALILADGWKRVGIETPLNILSFAQAQGFEVISTFPALRTESTTADSGYAKFPSSAIATAARGWTGANRSGYSDPEYDRLYGLLSTSIDSNDRTRTQVQAMKLLSDQAAYFPLYYGYAVVAHGPALGGPLSGYSGASVYKVEEWHWR